MFDHVFTDAVGALRDSLERALIERQGPEERFSVDMISGETTWEARFGLPGEETPLRMHADVSFVWPSSAQSSFRSWYLGDALEEIPRIPMVVAFRIERLVSALDLAPVNAVLTDHSPTIGRDRLRRSGPTVEALYLDDHTIEFAVEVTYTGEFTVDETHLAAGDHLDQDLDDLGAWIASSLVRLGDLPWEFLP